MDTVVYTIGHSNHSAEAFVRLLAQAGIEVLADVRSNPTSAWATYTSPPDLKQILKAAGVTYVYLGDALGGRPTVRNSRTRQVGKPDYQAMQTTKVFQQGIAQLLQRADKHRTCIMCAEENPSSCHRALLVGEALRQRGVQVLHIRGDGRVQTNDDLWKEKAKVPAGQLSLSL